MAHKQHGHKGQRRKHRGVREKRRQAREFGDGLGLAFQLRDDILDVTSTQEVLGKPIGSDARNEKTTYVTLRGIEASKAEVKRLSREAVAILHQLPGDKLFLEELIRMLIVRNH